MKKLLKSNICGSVNSTQMHCSRTESQQNRFLKKNNKKRVETQRVETQTHCVSAQSKRYLTLYLRISVALDLVAKLMGQSGQIPLLAEIFGDLPLFWKYTWIYHFFRT